MLLRGDGQRRPLCPSRTRAAHKARRSCAQAARGTQATPAGGARAAPTLAEPSGVLAETEVRWTPVEISPHRAQWWSVGQRTPTLAEIHPKLAGANQRQIETNHMCPRRFKRRSNRAAIGRTGATLARNEPELCRSLNRRIWAEARNCSTTVGQRVGPSEPAVIAGDRFSRRVASHVSATFYGNFMLCAMTGLYKAAAIIKIHLVNVCWI